MITTIGSLVMVGLNTATPQIFWNGKLVSGIVGIRVDWESDEQRIRLMVNGTEDDATYAEMLVAGVNIKRVNK